MPAPIRVREVPKPREPRACEDSAHYVSATAAWDPHANPGSISAGCTCDSDPPPPPPQVAGRCAGRGARKTGVSLFPRRQAPMTITSAVGWG